MSEDAPPTTLVWFRRDLRIHDHAPLCGAAGRGPVLCVFCLDPRSLERGRHVDAPRTGARRLRFVLESLADLRSSLRRIGGDLVVRIGRPEDVVPELLASSGALHLAYHECVGTEEAATERAVVRAADRMGVAIHTHWDLTLLPLEELPFAVEDTPEVFTAFRKRVEKVGGYTAPLSSPTRLTAPPAGSVDPGAIPTLADLGVPDPPADDPRAALSFRGGERAGRRRVDEWMWERDRLQHYKTTRNRMTGADGSSKFSAWLALGCLSPRWVQAEIERYERERIANESTYWLTFELLWRDYFQIILRKHGAALFRASGLQGLPVPWRDDPEAFARWRDGMTGFPIVDASMRELSATGFLSNRGRQIVASFLTKNLGLDWRLGAEWFESCLIDHDVAANYGNWNYGAGVGNDARGFRYFHLPTQAEKYDRRGDHARLWCPELQALGPRHVHAPWTVPSKRQRELGVVLGRDYPDPMVDLETSVEANRLAWERAVRA